MNAKEKSAILAKEAQMAATKKALENQPKPSQPKKVKKKKGKKA